VHGLNIEYRARSDEPMKESGQKNYDLQERLIEFAVRVLNVVESLPTSRVGNHVANQLVRSGTSPAPNYGEAQSAESRKDFIHKMKVALKELRETLVWLRIIQRKPLVKPLDKCSELIDENNELISIFVASIATAQKNLEQP
jgi:four helix bundle protein